MRAKIPKIRVPPPPPPPTPGEQFKKTPPTPAQCAHPLRRRLRKHSDMHGPAPDTFRNPESGSYLEKITREITSLPASVEISM